jgi:hypothetical protein
LMATSALMFDINVCLVFDMNVWFFISIPQTIKKKTLKIINLIYFQTKHIFKIHLNIVLNTKRKVAKKGNEKKWLESIWNKWNN